MRKGAPNPTTVPKGAFTSKKKTPGKSIRFKGLTLRSRSIRAGLEAPKLDIKGLMKTPIVIGQAPGSPLGSWDIAHAMSVQSQVSSPIRDHPAIHAQRTGSSAGQWPMPSQPLEPQMTGTGEESCVISKAGKDDIDMEIKPDLVKNLIKVFQLDTVDRVILDSTRTPANTPSRPKRGHPLAPPTDIDMSAFEGEGPPKFANYAPTVSMHGSISSSSTLRTLGTLGSRRGTVRKRTPLCQVFANPPEQAQAQEVVVDMYEARKAMTLLERLLPLAAHLIPLPADVDEDESYDVSGVDQEDLKEAREGLVRELEQKGLELVMLFEEEPLPLSAAQSPDLEK
ncbi:hypothetical protein BCR39DRAFT_557496 [Naematelia encephala]|uniref:Uncharacterized protein n=1 Tax=Naematelia encephala TaxID=71784 RepID=A0A1Y2BCR5_9TREE|nr:hypothetical protein BCR39DRAFT_557496 [Naematelia encephala]